MRARALAVALCLAGCAQATTGDESDGLQGQATPSTDAQGAMGDVPRLDPGLADGGLTGDDAQRPADDGAAGSTDADPRPAGDARVASDDLGPPPPPRDAGGLPPGPDAAPPPPDPDAGAPPRDAAEPGCVPSPETCNGVDDDCSGVIDDRGACGAYVQQNCRLWLGWADDLRGPRQAADAWGPCPPSDRVGGGDLRCTATRGDGRFAVLRTGGDVDDNDQFALAFTCTDAGGAGPSAWLASHCAVFLGHSDDNGGAVDGSLTWGGCPDAVVVNQGPTRCTSSGFDGRFRAVETTGDVDGNDDLGLAFVCRDAADPTRAGAVAASVEVFLGHADDGRGPPDGSDGFGACPAQSAGEANGQRCVGSRGDSRFHHLDLTGDVDDNDDFGIALRARRVP